MFLRQFEYLIALEKEGHFGRAAERCHVSQPSLSSALQQLEAEARCSDHSPAPTVSGIHARGRARG
ncbi:LysR family transcriptional regulator [Arenicellales bacterium nBUS_45]